MEDPLLDHFLDDRITKRRLVREVVIERSFGDAGMGQDRIQARGLEPVAVDFLADSP